MPLTDLTFLQQGAEWPPPCEKTRLDRYEVNRKLWKGKHDDVWGNWYKILRQDINASLELMFNWHKRLSTHWADLLLSEPPRFLDGADAEKPLSETSDDDAAAKPGEAKTPAPDPKNDPTSHIPKAPRPSGPSPRQEAIDRISGKDENGYVNTLYKVAIDNSRYGDGLVKITLEEEGAAIWAQPPSYWFPVVDATNINKINFHVLAWCLEKDKNKYLFCEIHEKGKVHYRAFQLQGNRLGDPRPISMFTDKPQTQRTGINDFLVVPFQGLLDSESVFGNDDYQDLDSIIGAIEVRAAQINNVLDKHTDPNMYGPPDLLEKDEYGNYVFKGGGRYFEVDGAEDDVPPGYVTWEGQLESQFRQLEFLIEQLYFIAETTPAAFGQQKEGLAESGSALRRLMMAPLAKVARITMKFDPAAKKALKLAAELERANGRGTPTLENIQIQWQDGLPADPKEMAETEQIRTGNKPTSSQVSSIRRIDGGTQEEAEAEQARIDEESSRQEARALANAEAIADTKKPEDAGDESKTSGNPG